MPASSLLSRRRQGAFTALLLATAACLWAAAPAHAEGPIKRWVDERGMVHYGDALPAKPVRDVKTLPDAPQPSANDLARGQSDLDRYRQELQTPAPIASAPQPQGRPAGPAQPSGPLNCAQQWQRFDEAYRCMDAYRVRGGGIKTEGFAECPVVKERGCPRP